MRPRLPGPAELCHHHFHAAFVFEPAVRPEPRRLRRRRTVFAFDPEVAAAPFFRAIFAATAFGRRPGPPGRHVRRVPRRRRRPFFDGFFAEIVPTNDQMAFPTSSCTKSRMIVSKLFCLGIPSSSLEDRYTKVADSFSTTGMGGLDRLF